jgi:hypothetical protein
LPCRRARRCSARWCGPRRRGACSGCRPAVACSVHWETLVSSARFAYRGSPSGGRTYVPSCASCTTRGRAGVKL